MPIALHTLTIKSFLASLTLLEKYISKGHSTHFLIDDNKLFCYLPKGKTPAQEVVARLQASGWSYAPEFNCFFHETYSSAEMLTHDQEVVRNQAQRHAAHLAKMHA